MALKRAAKKRKEKENTFDAAFFHPDERRCEVDVNRCSIYDGKETSAQIQLEII